MSENIQDIRVAVMQPYLFPYIGYFQMIKAVDKFVFYDDVNFIKQGWINRNQILVKGKQFMFTVPLKKASSFELIKDTFINSSLYPKWNSKFQRTIKQTYKKAPNYNLVSDLIVDVLDRNHKTINALAIDGTVTVSKYLKLNTEFLTSSSAYENKELERLERLIYICKKEKVTEYINAVGGQELYSKSDFQKEKIKLSFIKSLPIEYTQFDNNFVPWLSIIDVLMFNSVEEVNMLLDKYELK